MPEDEESKEDKRMERTKRTKTKRTRGSELDSPPQIAHSLVTATYKLPTKEQRQKNK